MVEIVTIDLDIAHHFHHALGECRRHMGRGRQHLLPMDEHGRRLDTHLCSCQRIALNPYITRIAESRSPIAGQRSLAGLEKRVC